MRGRVGWTWREVIADYLFLISFNHERGEGKRTYRSAGDDIFHALNIDRLRPQLPLLS